MISSSDLYLYLILAIIIAIQCAYYYFFKKHQLKALNPYFAMMAIFFVLDICLRHYSLSKKIIFLVSAAIAFIYEYLKSLNRRRVRDQCEKIDNLLVAYDYTNEAQKLMIKSFKLNEMDSCVVFLDNATIIFSKNGKPQVKATTQIIGSYLKKDGFWKWPTQETSISGIDESFICNTIALYTYELKGKGFYEVSSALETIYMVITDIYQDPVLIFKS